MKKPQMHVFPLLAQRAAFTSLAAVAGVFTAASSSGAVRYRQKIPSEEANARERQWLAGLQARDEIHNKEKLVRRAYLLLMRYHRAANAERAAKDRSNHQAKADVQFELRNVQTGPVEDILDEPISDVISLPKRNTLVVWAEYYYFNEEPKHVIYQVRWNEEGRSAQPDQSSQDEDAKVESTVREFLANSPDLSKVQMYTSYEVTLKLAGRERNYRAMDMSLVNGGKFEAFLNGQQAAWGPNVAHQEHRVGINCDVRNFNVPTVRRAVLEEIFRQRGSPAFLDEGNHWHLRFQ